MQFSRRRFLLGASTIALVRADRPALAAFHGSAGSVFNGGKSQAQSWALALGGDFPFLNLMKAASPWNYSDNQGNPTPDQLDTDGYPLSIVHLGVKSVVNIFPNSARSGIYVLTWSGNGTISVGPQDNAGAPTAAPGFSSADLTSTTGSGRYEFTVTAPVASQGSSLVVGITALTGPIVTNLQLFYKADEAALNAGQIFGTQFLAVLAQGNPGVLRFLDWQPSNDTNLTTWATRKPRTYFSYVAYELRSSLYAGATTSSGVKFSATFGSGAPSDKQTILVKWNDHSITISIGANAQVSWTSHGLNVGQPFLFTRVFGSGTTYPSPIVAVGPGVNGYSNIYWVTSVVDANTFTFSATKGGANVTTSGSSSGSLTALAIPTLQNVTYANSGAADVVTWTNHGLSIGDAVSINSNNSFGMPSPLYNNLVYYVIAANFTANSFEFSLTPGGAAVSTSSASMAGQIQAFGIPTLSLNGTTAIPVVTPFGDPGSDGNAPFGGVTGTLVYDADLNRWLAFGGNGMGTEGINNGVPSELLVALCAKIGAHPHFVAPYLACDPMTDWHTQLATYVKNNGPSWMKPRFEGTNETWNPSNGFLATRYAWNKSPAHWGPNYYLQDHDWYGKILSTIGQAINAVYGGTPSTQTSYAVLGGIQTATVDDTTDNALRFTSAAYVAQAAAAQSGYTKSAAYNWATHIVITNYWDVGEVETPTEMVDAFNYAVTNNGNPTAQASILANYLNTANSGCTFTGSLSGGVLTVTAVSKGALTVGSVIFNSSSSVVNTTITSLGTGSGGIGTYNITGSQTFGSGPLFTDGAINGSPAHFANLVSVQRFAIQAKAFAASLGSGQISKMCGYEGGYSPDYPVRDSQNNSSITAITNATSAVVTVGAYNTSNKTGVGNPGVVGMPIVISGVSGMTQINTGSAAFVTVTAGSPGQVTFTAHGFSAGQPIFFEPQDVYNSTLPAGVIFGQAYYVKTVVDANTFTVSATNGGTAINMTGSQNNLVICTPCWVVTAISGNNITLNVNSSGFGVYGAGSGTVIYGAAQYITTMLRRGAKFAPLMQTYETQLLNDFASAGGEFPSCYFISGQAVWGVWDPDIYTISTPPQWAAIAAFNH